MATCINEREIPLIAKKIDGKACRVRYYALLQSSHPPETEIKVYRGGWTYSLGESQAEAEFNRICANSYHQEQKAVLQVKMRAMKTASHAFRLVARQCGKKKKIALSSSESDDDSVESETIQEDADAIEQLKQHYEEEIAILRTIINLQNEKLGE